MNRSVQSVALFVVAALVVLGAGWLLVLSPRLDAVAARGVEAQQLEDDNVALSAQVDKVRRIDRDAVTARLDALRRSLPEDLALPALTRDVAALAEAAGVHVVSVSRTEAEAAAEVAGAFAVPVTIDVEGENAAVWAFLDAVQQTQGRVLLITGVTTTPDEEAGTKMTLACTAFFYDEAAAAQAAAASAPAPSDGASAAPSEAAG